jgi:hypothetical protein
MEGVIKGYLVFAMDADTETDYPKAKATVLEFQSSGYPKLTQVQAESPNLEVAKPLLDAALFTEVECRVESVERSGPRGTWVLNRLLSVKLVE